MACSYFYDLLPLSFLEMNQIHAQKRVPHVLPAEATWQEKKKRLLKRHAVQIQHNGHLKPHEKFMFLPHKEAVPTITALRSCPSLAEAAGWWTFSCRTPAPQFWSPRANPKYCPKYPARLALAHPGTLYSSASTSDALRIIMSVKLSKHFTAEWTHPGNLSRIRWLPVDEYFSQNNHSVSNLQPCSLGKTHKIPSKNEHER